MTYLEPCLTFIFRILAYLEPKIYSELCQTRNIQDIQNAVKHSHIENPARFRTLSNSEFWHIYTYLKLRILATLTYLKPDTHSEPSQRFNMEFFAKIVKSCNYFFKAPPMLDF